MRQAPVTQSWSALVDAGQVEQVQGWSRSLEVLSRWAGVCLAKIGKGQMRTLMRIRPLRLYRKLFSKKKKRPVAIQCVWPLGQYC